MTKKVCKDCKTQGVITTPRPAPHPGPRCATHHRLRRKALSRARSAAHVHRTYQVTADRYGALYEAQGGVCALCQRATGKTRRLSVDHDHRCCPGPTSCGRCVRGLLCRPCNDLLGHFRDDPVAFERAASYLRRPPAQRFNHLASLVAVIRNGLQEAAQASGRLNPPRDIPQQGPAALREDELDWAELGRQVKARRLQQRLAQGDLASRGGPGEITVRKIERGEARLRGVTKSQLEHALGWSDGIVDRILDGTVTEEELRARAVRPPTAGATATANDPTVDTREVVGGAFVPNVTTRNVIGTVDQYRATIQKRGTWHERRP